ncbi:MAG TPA: hypothetical protein VLM11_22310 [Streptosporangiaceae bacterium]|nr:hypothetical protein [Streptosporangiaceae bacterium]
MAIVVLALWIAAAAAGVTLLRAGGAARRRAAATVPVESAAVRIGAVPLTAEGKPPPGPRVKVTSPPGEHPFLEFSHPALAVTGIACWLMFVLVHYRPFAWIAFGILLVTMAVGLSWLAATRRAASHGVEAMWTFPPRLVAVHGLVVTLAIALTVLTAISAST